jgi:hypothetical protein
MHDAAFQAQVKTAAIFESYSDVAKRFECSRAYVRKVCLARKIRHARKERKLPEVKFRRAKVRVIHARTSTKENRKWKTYSSAAQIQTQLQMEYGIVVDRRTVQRDLRSMGKKARVRKSAPSRTRSCLRGQWMFKQFCEENGIDSTNLYFSDEVWFSCLENTGRIQWVDDDELPFPTEVGTAWNYPRRQCWTTCGVGFKGKMEIFPLKSVEEGKEKKGFTLNADRYQEYCLEAADIANAVPQDKWFLQDGARCHTANSTKAWHKEHGVKVVQNAAYSPNLNCIELVWKEMHALIGRKCPMDDGELVKAILEAWDELPQGKIDAICGHFDTELALVEEQDE